MTVTTEPNDQAPRYAPVHQLVPLIMEAVGSVAKNHSNQQFKYNFRSIDDIVNAVSPALREHGCSLASEVVSATHESYTSRNNAAMERAVVHMRYRLHGPHGDYITFEGVGEASDSSDKAHMKAMQQAFKYALVQALCIPTGDPDPDATSPEGRAVEEEGPRDFTNWGKAKVLDLLGGDADQARTLWEQLAADAPEPLPEDEALAIYAQARRWKEQQEAPFDDEEPS